MISAVFFDIDGVLTDGKVYVNEEGREWKSFRLTEIDAINDIKGMGIRIVAITGETTPITEYFRRKIAWDEFFSGYKNKADLIKSFAAENRIDKAELCYIGDGKYDVSAIQYAGLGVCPENAIQEVKDVADIVLNGRGGESCIYELYQLLKNRTGQNG